MKNEFIHIVPNGDTQEHITTETRGCWCPFAVDEEKGLIIHQPSDGRTHYQVSGGTYAH